MGDGQSMSTTKKVLIGVGIVAVGALAYALLAPASEEPPIRVKGGSLDIEICSGGTESWDDGGNHWKLKSSGTNGSGYNFTILVGNYCTSSGTPPSTVKELTIGLATKSVTIKPRGWISPKTKITPKGDFIKVPNNPKIVTNPKSGAVTITVKPGYGTADEWSCTFPEDTFQELSLYRSSKCPQ
jgi:hypothetical protein